MGQSQAPMALQFEAFARAFWILRKQSLPIESFLPSWRPDLLFKEPDGTLHQVEIKLWSRYSRSIVLETLRSIKAVPPVVHASYRGRGVARTLFTNLSIDANEKRELLAAHRKEVHAVTEVFGKEEITQSLMSIDRRLVPLFHEGNYRALYHQLEFRALVKNADKYTTQLSLTETDKAFFWPSYLGVKKESPLVRMLVKGEGIARLDSTKKSGQDEGELRSQYGLVRHFSSKTAMRVLRDVSSEKLKARKVVRAEKLVYLVGDLKNFSTLVENTRSLSVTEELLHQYYDRVRASVHKHDGLLDKFIGDGVVAVFGFPYQDEGYAEKGLECCWEIVRIGDEIERKWLDHLDIDPPEVGVRVGMAYGEAIILDIGDSDIPYEHLAIISRDLIVAARLEPTAATNGVRMSHPFYALLGRPAGFEEDKLTLKGIGLVRTWAATAGVAGAGRGEEEE